MFNPFRGENGCTSTVTHELYEYLKPFTLNYEHFK